MVLPTTVHRPTSSVGTLTPHYVDKVMWALGNVKTNDIPLKTINQWSRSSDNGATRYQWV